MSTRTTNRIDPLLQQAARLLHVGLAALETGLSDEPGPDEVRAVVQAAQRSVMQWFDENEAATVRDEMFKALSVLMFMDVALSSDVDLSAQRYCAPIRNGLELTRDLLEEVMADPVEHPRRARASASSATLLS